MGKNKRMQHTISHFYYAIIRSNQTNQTKLTKTKTTSPCRIKDAKESVSRTAPFCHLTSWTQQARFHWCHSSDKGECEEGDGYTEVLLRGNKGESLHVFV